MNAPTNRYYELLHSLFNWYGLKPDVQPRRKLIRTIFVNLNMWTLIILQMLNFVMMEYKAETFIEILAYLVPCLTIAISYYTIYLKQDQTWNLFHEIDRDFEEIKDIEEIEIMAKYADEWRLYVNMLLVSFHGSCIMLFNVPILSIVLDTIVVPQNKTRTHQLPILIECFIDRDKYFYEIFFFVYFLVMVNGTLLIVMFAMFLMFIQYARGLFQIVGHILEHILDHRPSGSFKNRETEIYESVVRVIESHRKAISFVDKLNMFVENTYLMNITLVLLMIGVNFVKIFYIRATLSYTQQLISVCYGLGNFTWIYLNCYIGQQLLDQSEAVFEKIWQTPWYLTSTRIQKLSLLMMQSSIKPSCLSIGKIFIASHKLFLDVVRTSLSYTTVYYSVR